METRLNRIANRAREDGEAQFSSLIHLLNEETLRASFRRLKANAAPGPDQVTKDQYGERLEENLSDVVARLKQRSYHPQAVRRHYIPKDGSGAMRPLGIPALEDKLVQTGMTMILASIYEQDFKDCSYGFRPGRSGHDALKALDAVITRTRVNYVVDADIRGFFDHVDHEWMMTMLQHRIVDTPLLQLTKRFLKAGIMEEGKWLETEEGVPQGGSLSPLLANVYLHYSLDLWFESGVKPGCRGEAHLVRYADDFVACFQHRDEAERYYQALQQRLAKFGLEVATEKTRILEFGRFAEQQAERKGEGKPETFDFLGFTHYCGRSRQGTFRLKRRTSGKKFRAKVKTINAWLQTHRRRPIAEVWGELVAKLRGHYQYYGVTDNMARLRAYRYAVLRLWYKWLNRRGQKRSYTWETFLAVLQTFPLPQPRIRVTLYQRYREGDPVGSRMR